ncbi:hypothetical protein BTO00_22785, partial [Vibrio campbellii]|uniref:hypothetical protein n=1 Tax=Vibrio campbellii TaxID=680 RepID=UPI000D427452
MNRLSNMLVTIVLVLVACDSSNLATVDDKSPDLMVKNTINGVVVANKVSGAQVEVYAVEDNGDVGQLLNFSEVFTNGNGSYTIEIPEYSGQVLVISKGGSYKDEATGLAIDLTDTELRAVTEIAEVTEDSPAEKNIAVITPLTELSTQLMDGDLSSSNAEKVNTEIAQIFFGTADPDLITKTSPIVEQDENSNGDTPADEQAKSATLNYNLILSGLSSLAKGSNPVEALAEIKQEIVVNDGDLSNDFKEDLIEGAIAVLDSQGIEVELENNTVLNVSKEFKEEIKAKVASDFFARKLPQLIEVKPGNINAFELLISEQLRNIFDFKFFIVNNDGTQEATTAVQIPTDALADAALLVELTDKEMGTSKTEYVNFTIVETVKEFTYNIANVNNNGLIPLQINQISGDDVEIVLNNMSKRTIEMVEVNDQTFLRVLQDGIAVIAVRSQADSDVTFANFSFNVIEDRNDILDIEWSFDGDRLIADYRSNENFSLFYEINDVEFGELDVVDRGPLSLDDTLSFYYVNRDGIRLTNKVSSDLFSIVQRTSLKEFNQLEKDTISVDSFASVLDLSFQEANVAYYTSLLQESEAFASFSDLQTFIDTADRSMSAFKVVQEASVSGDDTLIETETFNTIINLTFDSNALVDYKDEIVLTETLSSIDALQTLIISVDNSLNAMAKVKGYALGSISEITVADFDAILHLTHFDPAQLPHYQTALRIKGDVGDITALDRLLLNVNQEQALLASANSMIASAPLMLSDWFDGQLISAFVEENLDAYNSEIIERQPLDSFAAIVVLVDEVNDSVGALNKMNQAAITSDTTTLTVNDFENVLHLENFDVENFAVYLQAIASQEAIKDVAALNRILLSMNDTQGLLAIINEIDEESPLGLVQWQANGAVENVRDGDYLAAYNAEAIKRKPLSSMDDIQRLVNDVNLSVTALIKIQNAVGNVNATIDRADFNAILHLEHFDALNEAAYVPAIINGDDITSVEDLSQVLNRTNQELGLLAAVNDSRDKLSLPQWQADDLLIDVMNTPAHLDGYHQTRLTRQPFASIALVQDLVNDVNLSIDALNKIAAAAGNDSSDIVEEDFTAILNLLHYEPANYAAYLNAIVATPSIPNLDALHGVLLLTNHQQALLKVVNDANEGLSEAQWQENGLVDSRFIPQNRAQYNDELSLRQPFTTFASIEALLDEVNASVTAFNKIQAAVGGDTSALSAADFNDILHLQGFDERNQTAYLVAISTATELADLNELNGLLSRANNEQELLAEVNGLDGQNPLTLAQWQADNVLANISDEPYLSAYNAEVIRRQPLPDVAAIQALVNDVNTSVTALSKIQNAVGGDTSALTATDFTDILHLDHFDTNHEAAYRVAISNASAIVDVNALSALLLATNQAQNMLSAVNAITVQAPMALTQWQADALLINVQTSASHLDTYNSEAMLRQPFADIPTLQAMIEDVNASVAALEKVRNLAGGNASSLTETDFASILHLNHFEVANLTAYQEAISAESVLADLATLEALLLLVNQQQALLSAVNAIDDNAPLDRSDWQADMLLNDVMAEPNLSQYNREAQRRQPINDLSELQRLINEVNASVVAFDTIQTAVGGDTSALTEADFAAILHLEHYSSANFAHYLSALEQTSTLDDLAALNTVLTQVNSEQDFLTLLNNITPQSPISLAEWQTDGLLASTQALAYLAGYNEEILNRQPLSSIEEAQVLIDEVNANVDAFAALDNATTTGSAEAVSIETFYALLGLDPALVVPANLAAYQDALTQSTSSDVDELSDVNAFLTRVNDSETALAEVNLRLSQHRAFDLDDVLLLKILALEDSYDIAHHSAYQIALANISTDALPVTALALDATIQETNTHQSALADLRLAITNVANIGDAIGPVRSYLNALMTRSDLEYQGAFNRLLMGLSERGSTFNTTYFDSIDGQLVAINPADNTPFYVIKDQIKPIPVSVIYSTALGRNVFVINGEERPVLSLDAGNSYRFDQSDASNANHPIEFTSTAGDFTMQSTGTPGTQGAFTDVTIGAANTDLSYFCTLHGAGMGNSVDLGNPALTLMVTSALTELGVTAVIDTQSGVTVNGQPVAFTQHQDGVAYEYLTDRGFAEPATETNRSLELLTVQNLDHAIQMISVHINAIDNINAALATDVTGVTLGDINRLVTVSNAQSSSLSGYQQAMLDNNLVSITDGSELQSLINRVNGDDALIALVNNAIINNTTLTQEAWQTGGILNDVRADGYLDAYQSHLTEQSAFTSAADIQTFINNVNNSVDSLALISAAADSDTGETVTLAALQNVIGLTNIDVDNLTAYRGEIVKSSSATLADAAALQAVIDRTNASVTAFDVVVTAAVTNNASEVSEAVLSDIIDLIFDVTNLSSYQSAITQASEIAILSELQTLINDVDASVTAFALVQNAALSNNASNITANVLADIIDLNVDDTHIQGYQAQIAAAASIETIAALQAILTEVDDSESAFEQVQAAASSGDATAVTATLLGRILNLTSDASHIAEYKNHIEAQSSIDSVASLQLVLTEVDDSLAAFELVQTAASSNNAAAVSDAVLNDILNLTHVSANALSYQTAIAQENSIVDVAALQALIDRVDASLSAFADVQQAASDSDAAYLSIETLSAIQGLTSNSANFSDYQTAIAAESSIVDVTALQALIDSVDASITAFAAVQASATSSDGSGISSTTLSDIIGLTFDSANLADYQGAIAAETSIADVAAFQALINNVDSSVSAFTTVRLAATNSDASGISTTTLSSIIGLTFDSANLADYQGAIAAEASIVDVAALQVLIDSVDASLAAFAAVQLAATSSDASTLTTDTLTAIRTLTFDGANFADYQGAIVAETSIADVAALQALINSVDASLSAFAAVQAAATNSDASGISSTTLSNIIGLTFDSVNFTDYQGAIATETSIADVAALQALIDSVDASLAAFAAVQAAA